LASRGGVAGAFRARTAAPLAGPRHGRRRRVELHGLRMGEASVSLAFTHIDGVTGFSLLDQRGELTVTMAAAPA
jgi:hypothetical protein